MHTAYIAADTLVAMGTVQIKMCATGKMGVVLVLKNRCGQTNVLPTLVNISPPNFPCDACALYPLQQSPPTQLHHNCTHPLMISGWGILWPVHLQWEIDYQSTPVLYHGVAKNGCIPCDILLSL